MQKVNKIYYETFSYIMYVVYCIILYIYMFYVAQCSIIHVERSIILNQLLCLLENIFIFTCRKMIKKKPNQTWSVWNFCLDLMNFLYIFIHSYITNVLCTTVFMEEIVLLFFWGIFNLLTTASPHHKLSAIFLFIINFFIFYMI